MLATTRLAVFDFSVFCMFNFLMASYLGENLSYLSLLTKLQGFMRSMKDINNVLFYSVQFFRNLRIDKIIITVDRPERNPHWDSGYTRSTSCFQNLSTESPLSQVFSACFSYLTFYERPQGDDIIHFGKSCFRRTGIRHVKILAKILKRKYLCSYCN